MATKVLSPLRGLVALSMFVSVGLVLAQRPARASSARSFCYTSASYGTRLFSGSTVTSGPSSPSQIGCTRVAPIVRRNTVAHLALAGATSLGVLETSARTISSPVAAQSIATVHGLDLLGGTITASVVRAESTTSFIGGRYATSDLGTTLVGLRVLGKPLSIGMRRNVHVSLPGIGFVVFNQQAVRTTASSASLIIDAVHVVVTTPNSLGIAPPAHLLVAHAMSGLQGPVVGLLGGEAYGTSLNAGTIAHSGPSFLDPMGCLGSHGVVVVRGGAGLDRTGVAVTGSLRNTVVGTVTPSVAVGTLTSTVHSADLLAGLVQASVVRATARIALVHGTVQRSDPGASFGTLHVAGFPAISPSVRPNTSISLPGIGTLYLHRVIVTPQSIEVRMIELVVTQSNSFGLPVGTDLRVAVARGSVR